LKRGVNVRDTQTTNKKIAISCKEIQGERDKPQVSIKQQQHDRNDAKRARHGSEQEQQLPIDATASAFAPKAETLKHGNFYEGHVARTFQGRGLRGRGRGRSPGRGRSSNFYYPKNMDEGERTDKMSNVTEEAAAVSESPLVQESFGGQGRGGRTFYRGGRFGRGRGRFGRGGRAGRAEVIEALAAKTWVRPRTMDEALAEER